MGLGRIGVAVVVMLALLLAAPGQARERDGLDQALRAATATFARAKPQLGAVTAGVETQAYGDALAGRRFHSQFWGADLAVSFVMAGAEQKRCDRFAAFAIPAVERGVVEIFLCPQFFSDGTDALRQTTILHEMVHAVAGPDECRAMAYTAQLQVLAAGAFQRVAAYWDRNDCDGSPFRLPQ